MFLFYKNLYIYYIYIYIILLYLSIPRQRVHAASHGGSVSSISWAPHAFGPILAAACADGNVSIISLGQNNQWVTEASWRAHDGGCNAVSWGPDLKAGALLASSTGGGASGANRIVTGGCDNYIKIWSRVDGKWREESGVFEPQSNRHSGWVRDAQWAPSMGLPSSTIACCDEKTVSIWAEGSRGLWVKQKTLSFESTVWKLSWSLMGNILAVSQGNNQVSLWKEGLDGQWQNLSSLREGEQPQQ